MLTKETEFQITVLNDGRLQHRTTTIVFEDGVELSRSHKRKIIDVGEDVTNEDQLTKDIANGVFTQARVNARAQEKANPKAPF